MITMKMTRLMIIVQSLTAYGVFAISTRNHPGQQDKLLLRRGVHSPRILQDFDLGGTNDAFFGRSDLYTSCLETAAEQAAMGLACTCNTSNDGMVQLDCSDNCMYCGHSNGFSSCVNFSRTVNFTGGLLLGQISAYKTTFHYDGSGNRHEMISYEAFDCHENGACDSCRVYVNASLCNSCSFCMNDPNYLKVEGIVVNCDNVIESSSFHDCLAPPGHGVFEALNYNTRECNNRSPPPPPNDNCTNAMEMFPDHGVSGTLIGAMTDSVPYCHTETGTVGVWYTFQGNGSPMLVSTCSESASNDSFVNVYQGSNCGLLECVEGSYQDAYCNSYGMYSRGSTVSLATQAGTTYFIYVSDRNEMIGSYEIRLKVFPIPANDHCQVASEITIDSGPVVGTVIFNVTNDRIHVCSKSNPENDGEAWYQFIATRNATLRASTCSNSTVGLSSVLTVAVGGCESLSCVAESALFIPVEGCLGSGTVVDFDVVAGTRYYLAVWGTLSADVGFLELEIRYLDRPKNDLCDDAEIIKVNSNVTSSLAYATLSTDESDASCFEQVNLLSGGGIWYSFVGAGNFVVASTCSTFATHYVTIYGRSCGALHCLAPASWTYPKRCAQSDYGSQSAPIKTEDGENYYVLISSEYSVASGYFHLSITTFMPIENDDCVGAIQLFPDGKTIAGSTEHSIYEDFANSCNVFVPSPGVWYFVVGTGGMIRANSLSKMTNFAAIISIYSGSCGNLQCVATTVGGYFLDDISIFWNAELSIIYYIRVNAYDAMDTGDFGIIVSPFEPAVNTHCDGAVSLSIGEVYAGSMKGASTDYESIDCLYAYNRPSLWYYIDGQGTPLKVSTCSPSSTFSGGMQVFIGSDCTDLLCDSLQDYYSSFPTDYDCASPAAATRFFAEEGMRYYILLIDSDPLAGANNTFTISVTEFEIVANDVCETSLFIPNLSTIPIHGSTRDSLLDNVTCGIYSNMLVPGVWYSVVGNGDAWKASIFSRNSNMETQVFIFKGDCQALDCIAFHAYGYGVDDQSLDKAEAIFWTEANVEYRILVSSASPFAVGDFDLILTKVEPPPNDHCENAINIADSGKIIGTLANATGFSGMNYSCIYDPYFPVVWYSLIGNGKVYSITTCSSELTFNSAIVVSTGSCEEHECIMYQTYNDMDCRATRHAAAKVVLRTEIGVTYFLVISRLWWDDFGSEFALVVSTLEAPSNDICINAISIQPENSAVYGSITNASGSMANSCYYCSDMPDVWYSLIGTGNAFVISTCSNKLNFDSRIMVLKGSCDYAELMAFSDYIGYGCSETFYTTARVVFHTEVGLEYFVVVQGLNYPSQGDFVLTVSTLLEALPNDDCSGALVIQPDGTTIYGSTENATSPGSTVNSCGGSSPSPDLWYRVEGMGVNLTASLSEEIPSYNLQIEIFEGVGEACDQSCIAMSYGCCAGAIEVEWLAELEVTYYIRVYSYSSSSNPFELRVFLPSRLSLTVDQVETTAHEGVEGIGIP